MSDEDLSKLRNYLELFLDNSKRDYLAAEITKDYIGWWPHQDEVVKIFTNILEELMYSDMPLVKIDENLASVAKLVRVTKQG